MDKIGKISNIQKIIPNEVNEIHFRNKIKYDPNV